MAIADLHPAVTAIPVGLAFGAILERVGLGDAKVIRGQLIGRDFTVILVMFGAIVTAMLGILWADAIGIVDLNAIATPPTDLGGQLIGAIIFGGGFGIAALCPGTACVAAASGRRDGIAAVGGVLAGTALTAALWPLFKPFVAATPDEHRLLPDDLGLPVWLVATGILVMALAARRVSRWVQGEAPTLSWLRVGPLEAVGLTLAIGYAAVEGSSRGPSADVAAVAAEIVREEDHVDAVELAEWIRAGRRDVRILDLREAVDTSEYVIPNARLASIESLATLEIGPRETVVLYSEGGAHAAQAWVLLRMRGFRNVRVLKDGMAAWEDEVMSPTFGPPADDSERARQQHRRELSTWFGGQARAGTSVIPLLRKEGAAPVRRRRNTC